MREFCLWKAATLQVWITTSGTEQQALVQRVWEDPRFKIADKFRDKIRTRERTEAGKFDKYADDRKVREQERTASMTEQELEARREKRKLQKRALRAKKKAEAEEAKRYEAMLEESRSKEAAE